MITDSPRVAKLRNLVDEAGGPAAFAKRYSRKDADKPIDETYISQILNGHRSFGEKQRGIWKGAPDCRKAISMSPISNQGQTLSDVAP